MRSLIIVTALLLSSVLMATGETIELKPAPSPVDNPLKGLVPYARPHQDRFPHSMEFNYLPLSDLVKGEKVYDWKPLEKLITDISSRGKQTVFRIYMEYPGHKDGIPAYLEEGGLKVHEWLNTNTHPFPPKQVRTPDYEDPNLRRCLKDFISEMGKKYDGDPRIGYITMGLLGTWGEWHTYPKSELFASKTVQTEILNAFDNAFDQTPVLHRYPAGEKDYHYAPNHQYNFGYHDDSFNWATLETGKEADSWFFMALMKKAGALDKWKTQPIGGEIRPETWGCIFDQESCAPKGQEFLPCVETTHATWLMDTGMFREQADAERLKRAKDQVRKLGYDFRIHTVQKEINGKKLKLIIRLRNQGVAPFYQNWPVKLQERDANDEIVESHSNRWSITDLLPGQLREWHVSIPLPAKDNYLSIEIPNPMKGGKPLRFANEEQGPSFLRIP